MDRNLAYVSAIPLDTDLLETNKNAYVGIAKLASAVLGVGSILNGFTCAPTVPGSLNVIVSAGEMYSLQQTDTSPYGSMQVDTTMILKQGIVNSQTTIPITAPPTVNYSQNYLIQFTFLEQDNQSQVLAYYNPTNPAVSYAGPNNSGTPNNTVRNDTVLISLISGVAALTGTQSTPTPVPGSLGGYVITVTNGQTAITSGNIQVFSSLSFITENLLQKISQATADKRYAQQSQVQSGNLVTAIDTGSTNSIIANVTPAITSYSFGMSFQVQVAHTNTGPTTVNFNGVGPVAVGLVNGLALSGNEMIAGGIITLTYNGSFWQLANPLVTNYALNPATQAEYRAATDNLHPLTPANFGVSANLSNAANGFIVLPGGVIFAWGSSATNVAYHQTAFITLPVTIQVYSLVATAQVAQGTENDQAASGIVLDNNHISVSNTGSASAAPAFTIDWFLAGRALQ